jgi:hypothetical protein
MSPREPAAHVCRSRPPKLSTANPNFGLSHLFDKWRPIEGPVQEEPAFQRRRFGAIRASLNLDLLRRFAGWQLTPILVLGLLNVYVTFRLMNVGGCSLPLLWLVSVIVMPAVAGAFASDDLIWFTALCMSIPLLIAGKVFCFLLACFVNPVCLMVLVGFVIPLYIRMRLAYGAGKLPDESPYAADSHPKQGPNDRLRANSWMLDGSCIIVVKKEDQGPTGHEDDGSAEQSAPDSYPKCRRDAPRCDILRSLRRTMERRLHSVQTREPDHRCTGGGREDCQGLTCPPDYPTEFRRATTHQMRRPKKMLRRVSH